MIEEAAAAFRVSIEYGDKRTKTCTFFACTELRWVRLPCSMMTHIRAHDEFEKVCFTGNPSLDGSTQQSQWFFGTTDLAIGYIIESG
jgi:hypothetical protein